MVTITRRRYRRRTTLAVAAATIVLTLHTRTALGLQSCTNEGQVHVPCKDTLVLEPNEKFLLTLVGHGCYDITLHSSAPLNVYFYEAQGSLYAWRLREMQAVDPDMDLLSDSHDADAATAPRSATLPPLLHITNATTARTNRTAAAASAHLCDNRRDCHRRMRGLLRRGVYNLVVAYAHERRTDADVANVMAAADNTIALRLESCDQVSIKHAIGLLLVACLGFASGLLCLCLLGEYVLGLRSVTKFRRTIQRRYQFIELTHVDPLAKDFDAGDNDCSSSHEPLMTLPSRTDATAAAVPIAPAHVQLVVDTQTGLEADTQVAEKAATL